MIKKISTLKLLIISLIIVFAFALILKLTGNKTPNKITIVGTADIQGLMEATTNTKGIFFLKNTVKI